MTVVTLPPQDVLDRTSTSTPTDVRPILARSPENAWERTEQLRTHLYRLLERVCAERGVEALVLQSHAYAHPAWVKFESWLPTGEPGVTARAAMTVNIVTKPYHRYEAVYKVDWEKHGQKGVIDQLYRCGESEVERLLAFLGAQPASSLARRRVRRLLRPVQLRQQWYQVWKPRNTVAPIRRDWVRIASVASVAVGATMLTFGLLENGSGAGDTFAEVDLPPAIERASDVPAASPPPAAGTVQSGSLDDTDPRLDDGRIYEMRTVQGQAGVPLVITMQSSDFDTFLILGHVLGGTFSPLETNDDGANDGTNSRLEYIPASTGEYVVLFSSYEPGRTGAYSFVVP